MYIEVHLITVLRQMWLIPSMDPNVTLHVARLGECFITFIAGIWFLTSMDSNVTIQVVRM